MLTNICFFHNFLGFRRACKVYHNVATYYAVPPEHSTAHPTSTYRTAHYIQQLECKVRCYQNMFTKVSFL